ncbi:unnamed protein product, partial [Meganyctiphanes norvegica]
DHITRRQFATVIREMLGSSDAPLVTESESKEPKQTWGLTQTTWKSRENANLFQIEKVWSLSKDELNDFKAHDARNVDMKASNNENTCDVSPLKLQNEADIFDNPIYFTD